MSDKSGQMLTLYDITHKVGNLVIQTFEELKNCSQQYKNIITAGFCLGNVAVHIETKGVDLLKDTLHLVTQVILQFTVTKLRDNLIPPNNQFLSVTLQNRLFPMGSGSYVLV